MILARSARHLSGAGPKFKSAALSSLLLVFIVLVYVCFAIGVKGVWRQYVENKGDEGIVDFVPSIGLLAFGALAFAAMAVSTLNAVAKEASNVRQLVLLTTLPATVVVSASIVGSSAKRSAAILALLVGVVSVCVAATLIAILTRTSSG